MSQVSSVFFLPLYVFRRFEIAALGLTDDTRASDTSEFVEDAFVAPAILCTQTLFIAEKRMRRR